MSNDPAFNSALFDFCNRLNDGPAAGTPSSIPDRTPEEKEWLRQALESFKAPDKILKTKLNVVSQCVPPSTCPVPEVATEKKAKPAAPKPVETTPEATSAPSSSVGQPGLALIREAPMALLAAPSASRNTPAVVPSANLPAVVTPAVEEEAPKPVVVADNKKEVDTTSLTALTLSLIHISEPTRLLSISYAVFCLKKKKKKK
eukprot:TRINITY_DN7740_c0_g1_i1.p2 TRINITY_DN7740_c0_g1~~TRINITY_DN7740_c0_g1_i1.p2  ORF type:complete len:202 (+),score=82.78 TRINITY_DN7740_c0_g1_i1:199-804(+)